MNSELLLKHFDRISDAPDAVARLRESILDLAVRGKLVAQDACDEPASNLLAYIKSWRLSSVANKSTRAPQKKLWPIGHEEAPFSLPAGWAWARLGELIYIRSGDGLTKEQMRSGTVPVFGGNGITGFHDAANVCEPSIVIGRVGYYCGSIHLTPSPAWVTDNAFVTVYPHQHIFTAFLVLLLRATNLKENEGATAQPVISGSKIYPIVVALPPLAEQHRIVAKVSELMALCDRLEEARKEREARRDRLTAASLHHLNNAAPGEDLRKHASFFINHLPKLTARPDQILPLRRLVLSLAIRGNVVAQDPVDLPASDLLASIKVWRSKSVASKSTRAPIKMLRPISQDELPFPLPEGWAWVRLGELIYIRSGDGLTKEEMRRGTVPVFGGNGVTGLHNAANIFEPSIVIGRVGYYCGSIHLTPSRAWVTDNAFITTYPQEHVFGGFLVLLLTATNLKENEGATAQPVISGSKIYPIVVALPPLAEQHRLVAKVDELMSLCDRLGSTHTERGDLHRKFLSAVLAKSLDVAADA
jgi:type I restriction enzyme, S subunit